MKENLLKKCIPYEKGTMEITTTIGCEVYCRFCPQKILIRNYYLSAPISKKYMEFQTYKICLDKIPRDIRIDFSGMAEPWLNSDCTKMVKYALERGYEVAIYTTLLGMKMNDFNELKTSNFARFVIHIPDSEGNSRIPINKEYKELLYKIINSLLGSKVTFSCHGSIHPAIRDVITKEIIEKYKIKESSQLLSRG